MKSVSSSATALLPIIAMIFIPYLVIGIAMSVLPLHVHPCLRHRL